MVEQWTAFSFSGEIHDRMIIREDIPNFTWAEVLAGFEPSDRFFDHMVKVQTLRDWWQAPIAINSGFRSATHNEAIGGAETSQHMIFATDLSPNLRGVRVAHTPPPDRQREAIALLADQADQIGFDGIGLYDTFVHLDLRGSTARWDNRT